MTYAGTYNGFTFGTGERPGASVALLSGWRANSATIDVTQGSGGNTAGTPKGDPGAPRLTLNLHADSAQQLDGLIDDALAAFTPSVHPLPLVIDGRCKWVQVQNATPVTSPEWPGAEVSTSMPVAFVAVDPVSYAADQKTALEVGSGSPVTSATFEAPNDGALVRNAPRAYEFSITAATNLVAPEITVDHADGTYERIVFRMTPSDETTTIKVHNRGATLPYGPVVAVKSVRNAETGAPVAYSWTSGRIITGVNVAGPLRVTYTRGFPYLPAGRTLTIGADRMPRVGAEIIASAMYSYTQANVSGRAPRWWRLHPSNGTDEANVVTISGDSGTFYGTCKIRSTR